MKRSKKIQISLLILTIAGIFYLSSNRYIIKKIYPPAIIHVKIVHGVKNPGIYSIEEGVTLGQLIEIAGGTVGNVNMEESERERVLENSEIISIGVSNGGK